MQPDISESEFLCGIGRIEWGILNESIFQSTSRSSTKWIYWFFPSHLKGISRGWMGGWMEGLMDEWMNRWVDEWADWWMNGWMDTMALYLHYRFPRTQYPPSLMLAFFKAPTETSWEMDMIIPCLQLRKPRNWGLVKLSNLSRIHLLGSSNANFKPKSGFIWEKGGKIENNQKEWEKWHSWWISTD